MPIDTKSSGTTSRVDSVIMICRTLMQQLETKLARVADVWDEIPHLRTLVAAKDDFKAALEDVDRIETQRIESGATGRSSAGRLLGDGFRSALKALEGSGSVLGGGGPGTAPASAAVAGERGGHGATPTSTAIPKVVFTAGMFTPAEVCQILGVHGKSGVLTIRTEAETFVISFLHGDVVDATSDNAPQEFRLGEVLVRQGAIDRAALANFLSRHRSQRGRIGKALAAEEIATRGQIVAAICFQIQQLFVRCLSCSPETMEFEARTDLKPSDDIRLKLAELILDS